MRQKHIFKTDEILHKWAHQTQDYASNPQHNLYFEGATLYSYRDSAPIAALYNKRKGKSAKLHVYPQDNNKGAQLVLLSSERFSVTTSGHQNNAAYAVWHLPSVRVPDLGDATRYPKDMHAGNLKHFQDIAADVLVKAQRARQVCTVEWRSREAQQAITDWDTYAKFFGIRRKFPLDDREAWHAALDRVRRIESPDLIKDAVKFRAKQRREAALALQVDAVKRDMEALNKEQLTQWRTGASVYWKLPGSYYKLPRRLRFINQRITACRLTGDQVETTHGAQIPVAHCPRLWAFIKRCVESGQGYEHNGRTIHAGEYRIDRISADGDLKAGCHNMPFAELARLAVTLDTVGLAGFEQVEGIGME